MLTIIVKSVFEDEGKFYPHVYLDECFYQLGVQETLLASNIKMLEYDRIDISEVIDVNKTSASKECDIFHYQYFDIGFTYEPCPCNGSHDLMQKAMSFNDVAIVYVKESAYKIHFWYISKDDAINIMNNTNLIDKKAVL